jgi:hypothetical protein
MPRLLPWPDLLGARDSLGRIVVGRKRSRSKWSNTNFVFYDPRCKVATPPKAFPMAIAGQFAWANDSANIALLTAGLREVVNRKVDVPFDRGAVVAQVVDCTLVMYEAGYRGCLWPRYWWPLHLSCPPFTWALNEAILMETLRPDMLVARKDTRQVAQVEPHLPHPHRQQHPRWMGNLDEWITNVLMQEEAARSGG